MSGSKGLNDVRRRCVARALLAASLFASGVQGTAQALPPGTAATVVIWSFDDHTVAPAASVQDLGLLRFALADAVLESLLAVPGLKPVDRWRLKDILAEQKLGSSELADESGRLRLGRIVGAQYMVFGGFMTIGDVVQVNLRVVDTSTSEVVFADQYTAQLKEVLAHTQQIAARVAAAMGGQAPVAAAMQPDAAWLEYERALALSVSGHDLEAIDLLQHLLAQGGHFAAAELLLLDLYGKQSRQ